MYKYACILLFVSSIPSIADVVSVTPAKLDFGSQVVGTYGYQIVTLSNPTRKALNISSIIAGNDFTVVYEDCGAVLPPGYQCSIDIQFLPTTVGLQVVTLTIADDANNTPQKVKLSGTGIPVQMTSISVTPGGASKPLGLQQQFTATGVFNNGYQQDLTNSVMWSSSAPTVSIINSAGLAFTASQGVTTISAAQDALAGSTQFTVAAPVVQTIAITPAGASIPNGLTQQLTATATLTNHVNVDLTSSAQWNSLAPATASVNATGLVKGLAQGVAAISATSAGVTGSVNVTIVPPLLTSVALSPTNFSMGNPYRFKLQGGFSDGSTADISATANWSSDDTTIATPDSSGLVTGHQPGIAHIRAEAVSAFGHSFVQTASLEIAFIGNPLHTGSPRILQTDTLLGNGLVLVAGGTTSNGTETSTEIYNPGGLQFTVGPSMNTPRAGHTATLLLDGRVLMAGGQGLSSAELYDPAAGAFTVTGQMTSPRVGHTATLLNNGQVLIAGGGSATAELYDPASGTFSPTSSMAVLRSGHTATLLNDGRVMIAGGAPSILAEIFDPVQGLFSAAGTLTTDRQSHAAVLMGDGRVFLIGGVSGVHCLGTTEMFDPVTGVSTPSAPMQVGRALHTATILTNGQVLVAGGLDCDLGSTTAPTTIERFDPTSGTFTGSGNMAVGHSSGFRVGHTATLLPNGQVLLDGGESLTGFRLGTAEIYQPGRPNPPGLQ